MSHVDALVLVVALASTWAMTGVIWTIQCVHYPAFDAIERGEADQAWVRYGRRHRAAISWVVGPFMLAEGITGIWIVIDPPGTASRVLPVIALVLMAVAYGVTTFVSVPLHERLTPRWDDDAHRRLVTSNWWRTAAWTARGVVLAALAVTVASDG